MGIKRFFTSKKSKSKPKAENREMTNVVNSMFLCTPIYDKLKVKCHPDRFIDEKQKIIAQDLFQELQENKYNYEKLLEIELQVNRFESTIQK
ncbi:MAG: hypothetical protein PF481_02695 [Bacteroidales bacterium]|jgi:hypothetical protein|nr:hypothetical protein [Bacteroidales bacterium]